MSVQPLSAASLSALVWELEQDAEAVFGPSPIGEDSNPPSASPIPYGGRLYRAMRRLQTRTFPNVLASLNTTQLTLIHRTETPDVSDPLYVTVTSTSETVNGYIFGPSDESLEKGLISVSDFEVIVAANDLASPMDEGDSVQIDGKPHDIVGIVPYPKFPLTVAYRFLAKRAA